MLRRREGGRGEGPSLAITSIFFSRICLCISAFEFAYVFLLSISMEEVASENPFCILIYITFCLFPLI